MRVVPPDRYSVSHLVRSGDQVLVGHQRYNFRDEILPIISSLGSVAFAGLLVDSATR